MNKLRTYVSVEAGKVMEVIQPGYDLEGNEYPVEARFPTEFIDSLVEVTDIFPLPDQHWLYENGVFTPPIPFQRSAEENLAANIATRDSFFAKASSAIAPLQYAVDLDEATDAETALLKLWKKYWVALSRIDLPSLSVEVVAWPDEPQ